MYGLPGVFEGFDDITSPAEAGITTNFLGGTAITGTAAVLHTGSTGNVKATVPRALQISVGSIYGLITPPRSDIPWEEFIAEGWIYQDSSAGTNYLLATNNVTHVASLQRDSATGNVKVHYNSGRTLGATSTGAETIDNLGHMYSLHCQPDGGGTGYVNGYIDGVLAASATGLTFTTNNDVNRAGMIQAGAGAGNLDDMGFRPRTVIVTDVASGTTPTAITGLTGGATADVYAWETNAADSAGGGGNPTIPAGTWRLYLKNVSFSPELLTAPDAPTSTGFLHGEEVTVTGLTAGTAITVYAPLNTYRCGLEPGSQLLFQRLHVLGTSTAAVGAENTDGTIEGGATDREDALDGLDGVQGVSHLAAGEHVSVTLTAFSATAMAEVTETLGFIASMVGRAEGGTPDSLIPRALDNGGSAQNGGAARLIGASNTPAAIAFPANGAGTLWVPTGTGAGTLNSAEPAYETA